jgi:hypothetical protein
MVQTIQTNFKAEHQKFHLRRHQPLQPKVQRMLFFSSGEHEAAREEMDIKKWEAFIDGEMERGVNLAILIGGEPTLCLDRVEAFYKRLPTFCATNGLIKVPRDRFPDMMVGISLWGDEEDEKTLRGRDTFSISSKIMRATPRLLPVYHYPQTDR